MEAVLHVVLDHDKTFARDLYPVSPALAPHVVDVTNMVTCQSLDDLALLLHSPRWGPKKKCTALHFSSWQSAEPPAQPEPLPASPDSASSRHPLWVRVQPAAALSSTDVAALGAVAPRCPDLLRLVVYTRFMGPEVSAAVAAAAPFWQQLQHLSLGYNNLGTQGARHLANAARHLPQMQHLDLQGNSIRTQGAAALAEAAPHWPLLQHLDLHTNSIEPEGAQLLEAAVQQWPQLTYLDLSYNGQSMFMLKPDLEVRCLLQVARHCRQLRNLHLAGIVPAGFQGNAAVISLLTEVASNWQQLQHLVLAKNSWYDLATGFNPVTVRHGAAALAAALAAGAQHLQQLQFLDLTDTKNHKGAAHLAAAAQHWQRLQHLARQAMIMA